MFGELAYLCLLGSAFTAAFSLPAGRALLAASVVLAIGDFVRGRRRPAVPPALWLGALFLAVAVVATVFGVNPDLGVPKLRKLVWWMALPAAVWLVSSPARLAALLGAYAAGAGVLAVRTCVWHPVLAQGFVRDGVVPDFFAGMIHAGSMTDAQRLMVGVVIALALMLAARRGGGSVLGWTALLAVLCAALLLNFKRGSWFCALGAVAVLVAANTKWRYLLLLAALVLGSLLLQPVRARLADIRSEFTAPKGGRWTMWTKVAPALVKQHPWLGIGYRSLTNPMMRDIAPEVEPKRDHLHSNIAQVLVETGWIGFALFLAWMVRSVFDAGSYARAARASPPPERFAAQALLLALLALIANGLVEYNLGDAEIVLIYGFLMGSVAAARLWPQPAARPS